MVRLSFIQFIEEQKRQQTDDVHDPPMGLIDRKDRESLEQDAIDLANFGLGAKDKFDAPVQKTGEVNFDLKDVEKPVASGGSAKEKAQRSAKTKRTNDYFNQNPLSMPAALQHPNFQLR